MIRKETKVRRQRGTKVIRDKKKVDWKKMKHRGERVTSEVVETGGCCPRAGHDEGSALSPAGLGISTTSASETKEE